jgi:hypothetical protein
MKTETINIKLVKSNPNNPRIIKDDKFAKLVASIKEFPLMLQIRPIVVNDDMIVLGGNMRLKACIAAGLKEVPIIKVNNLTEHEQKQFIIKDNVSGGEWDWNILANEWDTDELDSWGLNIPNWSAGMDVNNMTDDDVNIEDEFDPIGEKSGKRSVIFVFDSEDEAQLYCNKNGYKIIVKGEAWRVDVNIQSI